MRPLKRSRGSPSIGETDARRESTGRHSTPAQAHTQREGSSTHRTHPQSDVRRESPGRHSTLSQTHTQREGSSSHRTHHQSDARRESSSSRRTPPHTSHRRESSSSSHRTPRVQSSGRDRSQTPPVLHRNRKPGWMLLTPYTDPCQQKKPRTNVIQLMYITNLFFCFN